MLWCVGSCTVCGCSPCATVAMQCSVRVACPLHPSAALSPALVGCSAVSPLPPCLPQLTQAKSNMPASPSCVATDSVQRALISAYDARSPAGESVVIAALRWGRGGHLSQIWMLSPLAHLRAVSATHYSLLCLIHRSCTGQRSGRSAQCAGRGCAPTGTHSQ